MKQHLDRTLRPALDACLSGTDALPSQRDAILRKAQERPAPSRLPRTGVIIAFTLLLTLISAAVAGTFGGVINWHGEPDDSAVPTATPRVVYSAEAMPLSIHTALTHLTPEDDRFARRVSYTDAAGAEKSVQGAIRYNVSSLDELNQLFATSDLMLPQGLSWPVEDRFTCYANVAIECTANGAYEKVGERTFDDGMVLSLYRPEEAARLVTSLEFSGWTANKWQVTWTARYQRRSDSLGFQVHANQQYQRLDIPGMTDAIAVTEANRTTIYMRKTLEQPIEYIYFDSIFIAEEDRRSPTPCFDEIYYEISGVAQSVDDLLALLPIG